MRFTNKKLGPSDKDNLRQLRSCGFTAKLYCFYFFNVGGEGHKKGSRIAGDFVMVVKISSQRSMQSEEPGATIPGAQCASESENIAGWVSVLSGEFLMIREFSSL